MKPYVCFASSVHSQCVYIIGLRQAVDFILAYAAKSPTVSACIVQKPGD